MKKYTAMRFIICTFHQIQGEKNETCKILARYKTAVWKAETNRPLECTKEDNINEDFEGVMVWTASLWLILVTISRLLGAQHWIFELHKTWAISRPTEWVSASEKGLCFKGLISFHLISWRWTRSLEKSSVQVMLNYYVQNSALRLT
jgi:hypothetical protein